MAHYNNRMFVDTKHGLTQEDRDAILGVLLRDGPYLVQEVGDSYAVFSDPHFLIHGYPEDDLSQYNSYEASKLPFFDQRMWSAWYRNLELEAAVAVTVANLRRLHFEDDEIAEFFCYEPEAFDVVSVTMNSVLSELGYSYFAMPSRDDLYAIRN